MVLLSDGVRYRSEGLGLIEKGRFGLGLGTVTVDISLIYHVRVVESRLIIEKEARKSIFRASFRGAGWGIKKRRPLINTRQRISICPGAGVKAPVCELVSRPFVCR
jgi:hypothetical protein